MKIRNIYTAIALLAFTGTFLSAQTAKSNHKSLQDDNILQYTPASLTPINVSPILSYSQPVTDKDGKTIYTVSTEKGWTCKPTIGPDNDIFILVCLLDNKK